LLDFIRFVRKNVTKNTSQCQTFMTYNKLGQPYSKKSLKCRKSCKKSEKWAEFVWLSVSYFGGWLLMSAVQVFLWCKNVHQSRHDVDWNIMYLNS